MVTNSMLLIIWILQAIPFTWGSNAQEPCIQENQYLFVQYEYVVSNAKHLESGAVFVTVEELDSLIQMALGDKANTIFGSSKVHFRADGKIDDFIISEIVLGEKWQAGDTNFLHTYDSLVPRSYLEEQLQSISPILWKSPKPRAFCSQKRPALNLRIYPLRLCGWKFSIGKVNYWVVHDWSKREWNSDDEKKLFYNVLGKKMEISK